MFVLCLLVCFFLRTMLHDVCEGIDVYFFGLLSGALLDGVFKAPSGNPRKHQLSKICQEQSLQKR